MGLSEAFYCVPHERLLYKSYIGMMFRGGSRPVKYFIRTVKFMQATLIKQSSAQVYHIITLIEQSNVSTEATKVYLWICLWC